MATSSGVSYIFGPFRLDTTRRILYSGSVPTHIPERLFQILLALLEANGKVVSREVLAHNVWGDAGVTDTNVNQHVYLLRAVLGERKNERSFIITVPGEGYRFAAEVTVVTPPPQDEDQVVLEAMRSGSQIAEVGNELFQLYCRGSYLLDRRTAPSLGAAADAFEAALRMDAEYVPALIGLARAFALLAEYWHVPPGPAFGKARSAVERALRWDQRSSMAHAVLSEIYLFADWDWSKAGRSAWTAIALNPQSAFARNNSAWYYVCRGELDKALGEAQHALIVEPASLQLQLLHARVLVHSGEYERAIRIMSNILEADPEYYAARRYRAQAYVLNAQYSEAIEELTGVPADLSEDLSFRLPLLGRAYAGAGNQHQALDVYAQLRLRSKTEYVPWWNQAIVAAGLHRTDETLHCLSLALRDREPTLLFLRTLRWFRAVEDTARFRRLLRHVGPKQSAGP